MPRISELNRGSINRVSCWFASRINGAAPLIERAVPPLSFPRTRRTFKLRIATCRYNKDRRARRRFGVCQEAMVLKKVQRNSDVQWAQRVAFIGIADRQCGQSFVVGAGASAGAGFFIAFIW